MRSFLSELARAGELVSLSEPVSRDYEIAACLAETDSGPALQFERIKDSGAAAMPIAGNLLNSLPRFALGLGTTTEALQETLIAAIERPLPHRVVAAAPCQESVVDTPSLTDELPIPRFFEKEGGPYITAGAIVAKDRATGQANLSIARLMPLGGNRAFVGIAPNHHLAIMARAAHSRGETLDIAVCIGNHPAVLVAACLYLGLGDDELPIAGALLGEPLEVVRCTGSDLLVPAHCECVLEGTLDAGEPYTEGAVSEFHGMYENYGAGIVATFARLTRRRDALFQVILPGYHPEHCLLGGVAIAAGLRRQVRNAVGSVREVAVGVGGAGRLHAVVTLHAPRPGEARKAMFAVWAAVNLIKQIVVVDDDIDPWNPTEVEWATATCAKPDRDHVVIAAVRADRSEPLEQGGTIAKFGIDATRKEGDRPDWDLARPPEAALAQARRILSQHKLI
ncbi:UbiD family decarboxylase [Bradyrhizobium elkanii]|uniref:4-hydroxy-3-polyprenylbenzoate decarboxylase n=1 Tax=Bradyrhizobium elkanii TaxID=29448 RepID=A0A8I1YAV8_BRAEL|nr:UbiD family decarboxylase [Bradyrhizobium elkanii]MBP1296372.1 4-hydroxy-3-polyprenylbenzoate decarboxylase [Bradyrhizobium elkanii]